MYEFYSEGFFGYGDVGDFHAYGPAHIIPILLLVGAVVFTFLKSDAIRNWKHEKTLRLWLAFSMLMAEYFFYWRVMYVGNEHDENTLITLLPFQLCEWGAICAAFMILSLNDRLFGINFFVSIIGAGIALAVPQTVIYKTGPTYFRYYQFWMEHLIPIYTVFYAVAVHKKRPKYRDIWIAYGAMALLAIPATIANMKFPQTNYLYLRMDLPLMPDSYPARVVIYSAIIISAFHILFGVWCLFDKFVLSKREKANDGK